jgi:spore coat protein U-like protein
MVYGGVFDRLGQVQVDCESTRKSTVGLNSGSKETNTALQRFLSIVLGEDNQTA